MAIKRNSCRKSERQRMKQMAAEGYGAHQISNAVSVNLAIVEKVLSGEWDEKQKAFDEQQKVLMAERAVAEETAKRREAEILGTAIASALETKTKRKPRKEKDDGRQAEEAEAEEAQPVLRSGAA